MRNNDIKIVTNYQRLVVHWNKEEEAWLEKDRHLANTRHKRGRKYNTGWWFQNIYLVTTGVAIRLMTFITIIREKMFSFKFVL